VDNDFTTYQLIEVMMIEGVIFVGSELGEGW
jgi:hypothetical protein